MKLISILMSITRKTLLILETEQIFCSKIQIYGSSGHRFS
jgi:hypothetical protein